MANLKKLTLLHSNDMHGDFLAEEVDGELVGGVSRLSGYVQKVRAEEENLAGFPVTTVEILEASEDKPPE